jgi:hypothetical protein
MTTTTSTKTEELRTELSRFGGSATQTCAWQVK